MSTPNNTKPGQAEDYMRLQDLLHLCLAKWQWFVFSLVATIGIATAYLLTTPPVYNRSASLLIKEENKGKSVSGEIGATFSDMGLFQSSTSVNNELISMQSPAVMLDVVKRLKLDIDYETDGRFCNETLYGESLPFQVSFPDLQDGESASLTLLASGDGRFELSDFTLNDEKTDGSESVKGMLNDTLATPIGKIIVTPSPGYKGKTDFPLYVNRTGLYKTTENYMKNFSAMLSDEKATVISLSFDDVCPHRAEDVLNMLIVVYNENWVKDKNQIAVSTSMFINERLGVIERELGNVDNDISSYKSDHLLPDVQAVSNMYMTQNSETGSRILSLNTQLSMARYIRNHLANSSNQNQLLPANSGLENGQIEKQISEYNTLQLQRNNLVANSSEQNPLVVDIDHSLRSMRGAIISSIDNQIVTLNTQIRDLRQSEQQNTAKIAANPTQAKYLLSVERQQKVKESLYLFLLQKREENELSQAFSAYNTRIITPPGGKVEPTSPVKQNILLVAFALGLLIPVAVIFIRENTNTTVRGRKDLERLTLPFIGEIPLVQQKSRKPTFKKKQTEELDVVVKEGKRDVVNEAFRVLRTNLEFMEEKGDKAKVILLTSFNPNSGKTFLAVNIAISLAIKGKKVLLIDGDLRHGSTSTYINSPARGLSNYLGGKEARLEDIILTDSKHENLHILPVGTMPPNPTELLFDKRLEEMIQTQRTRYDYIFIDCPPIEIVADTQIIEKFADRTIFVVRAGLLQRAMLPELENIYKEQKLKNMCLVLNGTESSGGRYGYGYSYGYGHSYHYTSDK